MINSLKKIKLTNIKLHIPIDVIVSKEISSYSKTQKKAVGNVKKDEYILDIGPDTISLYKSIIKKSKMIIWNGPMGMIEFIQYRKGTIHLLKSIMNSSKFSVIGGGDTLKLIKKYKKIGKYIHISSGGGAMLYFLKNERLPVLEPLLIK